MAEGATPRVLVEWRNRVIAEYTSAAYTAQALHWMIQAALPEGLQDTAVRIVGDELAHARLSYECLVALGGASEPVVLDRDRLAMPASEGLLAALVDSIGRNFCFGETFAVPLFAEMRRRATHPAVRPVLDRVLRDESVHRAFGWDALDALIEHDPEGVRGRVASKIPGWRTAFHRAYGDPPQGPPLLPEEEAMGLLPVHEYARIHEVTWQEDLVPRFGRRGIAAG